MNDRNTTGYSEQGLTSEDVPIVSSDLKTQWDAAYKKVTALPKGEQFIREFLPMLNTFVADGEGQELCLAQPTRGSIYVEQHAIKGVAATHVPRSGT